MKNLTKSILLAVAVIGLSACGNTKDNTNSINGANTYGTSGYYNSNGQWVSTGTTGSCAPLTGAISFSITGASVSATQILGGTLPSYGTFGSSVVNSSAAYSNYGSGSLSKNSYYGSLQLYAAGSNVISGTLILSQATLSSIMSMSGVYNNTTSCVSSVAVNAVYTTYPYAAIIQALVYVTVNGQVLGPIPLY